MTARLSINASDDLTFFVSGPTAPVTNVGPWIKNGTEWWVWSATTGAYVPITANSATLGYTASQLAPDPAVYKFWIKLDSSGNPIGIYYWYSGAWVDVYGQLFSLYSTTEQMNQILANGISSYPFRSVINPNAQTLAIQTNFQKVNFSQAVIDPKSCFDNTNLRYVARKAGIYHVECTIQIDNVSGNAANMQIDLRTGISGDYLSLSNLWSAAASTNPPGNRWFPDFSGLIQLAAGDYLEIFAQPLDGTNTGSVTASNGNFCVHLVNS
jgi:hypothetical protein